MDIFEAVLDDHKRIRELLTQLVCLSPGDRDYGYAIMRILRREVVSHCRAKCATLYQDVGFKSRRNCMERSREVAAPSEQLLENLQRARNVDNHFVAEAKRLAVLIEGHFQEEEKDLSAHKRESADSMWAADMGEAFSELKYKIAESLLAMPNYPRGSAGRRDHTGYSLPSPLSGTLSSQY